jgi:ubiquinone/menaquinone biosynthesis C-methylase UbiE
MWTRLPLRRLGLVALSARGRVLTTIAMTSATSTGSSAGSDVVAAAANTQTMSTSFEPFADYYAKQAAILTQPHAMDLIGLAQDKIRQAKRILELGCGSGAFGLAYQQFFPEGIAGQTIVCTDLSPAMVEIARKSITSSLKSSSHTEFQFQAADATNLNDFADQSFDMVVSVFGIFLVPDQTAMMREIRRVLKSGTGTLATSSWTSTGYNEELKANGLGANLHDAMMAMKPQDAPAVVAPGDGSPLETECRVMTPLDWFDRDKIRSMLLRDDAGSGGLAARNVTIRQAIHTATFANVEHAWLAITTSSPNGASFANQDAEQVAMARDALRRFLVAPHGDEHGTVFVFLVSNLVLALV